MSVNQSLLFDEKSTWMKKRIGLFDITIGAYDGAEVCELQRTYMLFLTLEKYNNKDFGLYLDDRLNKSLDRLNNKIILSFNQTILNKPCKQKCQQQQMKLKTKCYLV